jgi:hypothetical protein
MSDGNGTNGTHKKRRDWRTPFFAALREWPDVTKACSKAGIGKTHVYRVYRTESEFAREWDAAVREGIEAVEDEAWRRTKKSDTMLIFMLKSHKPAIYRETYRVEHDVAGELKRMAERLGLSAIDIASDPMLSAFFGAVNVKVNEDAG